ncbi:DUF4350 domain-containing protein [Cellulomonas wangsupingiae]|uniref:DUF4350 domain-containing protein n=1 Tax=Cellulomonas wangsupingiae TaxID=2968085 RepID=UPI001D0E14AE|nr:DUF4350 domain-containing protein [Cellulomonas wangsupingiae]MCM0640283.1 DUF4350 domain-containing protein [Cellulomonas wangsupingiae]
MTTPTTTQDPSGPPTASAEVLGDGSTGRSRAAHRWRRSRPWLALLGVVIVGGVVLTLPAPPAGTALGAPDNPGASGSRVVAQVLERQGVTIEHVTTTSAVVAAATGDSTVLVIGDQWLTDDQVDVLAGLEDDLVLVDAGWALTSIAPDVVASSTTASRGARAADCSDPDAVAAGTITAAGGYEDLARTARVCFPAPDDATAGAYLTLDQGVRRITALSDIDPLTNASVANDGNAALVLRMLGRHDHLVWYVPSYDDLGHVDEGGSGTALTDLVPWVRPVAGWLVLVLAVTVVWRARRLGPVVTEPLPVVVRSAEATRGRGRLYRRARAHGHAGAALRAGTAARVAHRLGLPRSADAPSLVDALARTTGRSTRDLEALLYGPPPTDDAGLLRLADDLHHLESEVHRP